MNSAPLCSGDMLLKKAAMSLSRILAFCILFLVFSFSSVFADCPLDANKNLGSTASGPCSYFDGECAGGGNPKIVSDCVLGMCAICIPPNPEDFWANPKLEILYMPVQWTWLVPGTTVKMPIYKGSIESSKCKWLLGVRFCVRAAKPAVAARSEIPAHGEFPAVPAVPAIPADPGNTSKKSQMCAYEDPCDGMDPPDGNCAVNSTNGPYHQNAKNPNALSVGSAAGIGAAGGFFIPGIGSAIGAVIGAISAAITQNYNHVVVRNIGCVDRPVGPMPPAWKNSAWFDNSTPMPTFIEEANSVFESPKIKMKRCKDSAGDVIACNYPSGQPRDGATEITSPANPILNPNFDNGYKDCYADDKDGTHTSTPPTDAAGRLFCAVVTTDAPDIVKITMLTKDDAVGIAVKTLPRAGYMPKPKVEAAPGSTVTTPKITISFPDRGGQSITLEDDPGYYDATPLTPSVGWDQTKICKTLHQVNFCIGRPCVPGKMKTEIHNGEASEICTEYQNMTCALGYTTGPMTVVNLTDSTTIANQTADKPIAFMPNLFYPKNIAFNNDSANLEKGAPLSEKYSRDIWAMRSGQTKCYKRSGATPDSYCQNYSGLCAAGGGNPPNCIEYAIENNAAAADLWYVNGNTQKPRPVNAYEAGLCIYAPPPSTVITYDTVGNGNYVVPTNCTEITVQVWGGGAKSRTGQSNVSDDLAGGAGGYASAVFSVASGQSIPLYVAAGGGSVGDAMQAQASGGTSWFSTSSLLFATGGSGTIALNSASNPGGDGGGTAAGLVNHAGEAGGSFHGYGNDIAGAAAYGSTHQPTGCGGGTNRAPFGGGGCGGDDTHWGLGGNGKITVQCTKGMD